MTKRIPLSFGPSEVSVEKRADGSLIVRTLAALPPYPRSMTDWFEHWAREAPERVFIAQRAPGFGPGAG